jgi:hypothetical protein
VHACDEGKLSLGKTQCFYVISLIALNKKTENQTPKISNTSSFSQQIFPFASPGVPASPAGKYTM